MPSKASRFSYSSTCIIARSKIDLCPGELGSRTDGFPCEGCEIDTHNVRVVRNWHVQQNLGHHRKTLFPESRNLELNGLGRRS